MTTVRIRKARRKTLTEVLGTARPDLEQPVEVLVYGSLRAIVDVRKDGAHQVVWNEPGWNTKPIRSAILAAVAPAFHLSAATEKLWKGEQREAAQEARA